MAQQKMNTSFWLENALMKEFNTIDYMQDQTWNAMSHQVDERLRLSREIPTDKINSFNFREFLESSYNEFCNMIKDKYKKEYIERLSLQLITENNRMTYTGTYRFDLYIHFSESKHKNDFKNDFPEEFKQIEGAKSMFKFDKELYNKLRELFKMCGDDRNMAKRVFGKNHRVKIIDAIIKEIDEYFLFELKYNGVDLKSDDLTLRVGEFIDPIHCILEKLTDDFLAYKENITLTKDYILSNIKLTDDIVVNEGDILIIKMYEKNKAIMSSKWCITESDTYWDQYNTDSGSIQHIYFDFKNKEFIGFNVKFETGSVSNAFNWKNMSLKNLPLEKWRKELRPNQNDRMFLKNKGYSLKPVLDRSASLTMPGRILG